MYEINLTQEFAYAVTGGMTRMKPHVQSGESKKFHLARAEAKRARRGYTVSNAKSTMLPAREVDPSRQVQRAEVFKVFALGERRDKLRARATKADRKKMSDLFSIRTVATSAVSKLSRSRFA